MRASRVAGMQARGYMLEVAYDGQTLTARGTTKAAQVALRGPEHADGDLVLDRSEISSVAFKPASPLVNGNLTIRTTGGEKYQLHFRRKSRAEFVELHRLLDAQESPPPPQG